MLLIALIGVGLGLTLFFWPRAVGSALKGDVTKVRVLPSGAERVEKLKRIKADAEALANSQNNIVVTEVKSDQVRLLFQPTFYPPGFIKATADFLENHLAIFETIALGAISGGDGETQYLVVFAERKNLGAGANSNMHANLFVSEVVSGIAFDKHILFLNSSNVAITPTSAVQPVGELIKKDFTANPFYKALLSDYEKIILAKNKSTN